MSSSILVVDDERALADAVADLLGNEGYTVYALNDGLAAFELALRESPDLILTDMQLPRLDGLALVRQLRAAGRAIPVVLMSAINIEIDIPGVRFVLKPFDLDHLLAIVREVLSGDAANW
jgi:two-component system OmpR family response regulator/two-component system response regulator QseB